jgi:hypothetical protein
MRARLILATLVAILVMAVACADEGTPQSPTPTLSEEEAWAMVQEKLVTACGRGGMAVALRQHESQYTEGRWDFWIMKEVTAEESWSGRARLERTEVQFTVYEATGTVTGSAQGLFWLSGRHPSCQ